VFVYTTFPSLVEAEAAAKVIVEQSRAACASILPGMVSVYRWEGKVVRRGSGRNLQDLPVACR